KGLVRAFGRGLFLCGGLVDAWGYAMGCKTRPCEKCALSSPLLPGFAFRDRRLAVAPGPVLFSKAPERVSHESYRRACRTFEVAGPRSSRGRAPQHHSDSGERPGEGRPWQVEPEGDRPRS